MDTGADQAVQGEAEIPEDVLLYPPQENLSQNNSSAQVTEDVDEAQQQLTDVQTVSESSGAETQPDSDQATDPGDGKT